MSEQDSHISQRGSGAEPEGPTRQHHRRALGEKSTGQTNPNGAPRGPTDLKIGNNGGKTY